jgi:hypothetical protein
VISMPIAYFCVVANIRSSLIWWLRPRLTTSFAY